MAASQTTQQKHRMQMIYVRKSGSGCHIQSEWWRAQQKGKQRTPSGCDGGRYGRCWMTEQQRTTATVQ